MSSKDHRVSPVNILADEVAITFGGVHIPYCGEYGEHDADVRVEAHNDNPAYLIRLIMRSWGASKGTVTVSVLPADTDTEVNTRDLDFPSAKVDPERPTQAIMADISRRVVNDTRTVPTLSVYAARLDALRHRRGMIKEHLAALLAAFPDALRSSEMMPPTSQDARFFNGSGCVAFEARVTDEGAVHFGRLGPVSNDQARRILTILAEG